MEQHGLKNINNCMNTNISSYLETSGGQSSYPYLNVAFFKHQSWLEICGSKTAAFLHWCLICAIPLDIHKISLKRAHYCCVKWRDNFIRRHFIRTKLWWVRHNFKDFTWNIVFPLKITYHNHKMEVKSIAWFLLEICG